MTFSWNLYFIILCLKICNFICLLHSQLNFIIIFEKKKIILDWIVTKFHVFQFCMYNMIFPSCFISVAKLYASVVISIIILTHLCSNYFTATPWWRHIFSVPLSFKQSSAVLPPSPVQAVHCSNRFFYCYASAYWTSILK